MHWDEEDGTDGMLSSTGRLYLDLVEALKKTFPSVIGEMAPEEIQREVFDATRLPGGILPLPQDVLDEGAKDAAQNLIVVARKYLGQQRQERLSQAHITFVAALLTLIIGIVLVFIGVILIYTTSLPIGIATAIASSTADIISALAFRFNKETNDRLDSVTLESAGVERIELAMYYIEQISNTEAKDRAIIDLIKRLSISPSQNNAAK